MAKRTPSGKFRGKVTIGYDPANATRLRQMLEGRGFACEVVRQGPVTLNDPKTDLWESADSSPGPHEPLTR